MKKSLHILFFILVSVSFIQAQSFSIEPIPASATADLQDASTTPEDVTAHAEITNLTSGILNLSWSRTEVTMPTNWTSGVCDVNYCYGIGESRQDFQLQPGEVGRMDVHAYPGGTPGSLANGAVPGQALIMVKITNKDDATDTLSATYMFDVTGEPIISSTNDPEVAAIKVFPNPTTDYFELTNASNLVEQVAIYNILGSQVNQYNAVEQRFDIAGLPQGLYLVSLLDEENKILKTVRLQKRNP